MLKIRLMRIGRRNDPKYRIVVAEARSKRDGRYVDNIGFYDPIAKPAVYKIDRVKLDDWQKKGAAPSKGLMRLLKHKFESITK